MAAMNRERRADPDVAFFLATDCAETEERFRGSYGAALVTNPAKRFVPSVLGQPKDNQYDAVIDLFTLARTQRILGTYFSTFSMVAAVLGGIERENVVDRSLRNFAYWWIRPRLVELRSWGLHSR